MMMMKKEASRHPAQHSPVTSQPMVEVARRWIELEDADPSQRRRPSDGTAAAAVKDAVKEAAQNKVTNSFGYQLPDLVGTPGTFQTIAQIWLFFLQKLSFQWHIGVRWPAFYVNFLGALAFLSSKFPSFWMIPDDCVFTAQLLLAPALLARFVYVQYTGENQDYKKAPGYDTAAETLRTIARGVAAPVLLSALAIAIGEPTGARWLTGLGVALCWPIIGYVLAAHVARTQLWKACKNKCVWSFSRMNVASLILH